MSGKGCCYSSCRSSSAPKVEVKKEVDVKPQQVAPAVPAIVQDVKAEPMKEVKVEAEPVKLFSHQIVKLSTSCNKYVAKWEVLPPASEGITGVTLAGATSATAHGIEVEVEFKPVEHPIEPLDNDRPIQCPLPEPSILIVP
ncbi:OLC1v1026824C1 [Oldenlandia corymbosa var. corymbosa]|uniref:OLC1v1026824C1 n=1 Tax=Oldenlandia corymbosa var. corymbosa TaxID=529605 RepID=A0AAV1C7Y3_OLDCO|nr:OLC1v1026824C1 [Oldenlandia corymbosa var. corymbosa]